MEKCGAFGVSVALFKSHKSDNTMGNKNTQQEFIACHIWNSLALLLFQKLKVFNEVSVCCIYKFLNPIGN